MSALSDLATLILRLVTNAPLTTKGSDLTYTELDNNFVKVFNALNEVLEGVNVPAYDAGATYDKDSADVKDIFVSYASKIWKAVYVGSPTAFSGQTPGETAYWTQVSLAQMLGNPVALTKIANAYDETQPASGLYETPWQSFTQKDLNTNPVSITGLPASGVGKFYLPQYFIFALDAGAVAYDFNNKGIIIEFDGGPGDKLLTIAQSKINSATDVYSVATVANNKPLMTNDKMVLTTEVDATVGNGTYYVKVIYTVIESPF